MKITLSAEDAERLGVPPVVEYDENALTGREAIALQAQVGWSLTRLGMALQGRPMRINGEQQYATDDNGDPQTDAPLIEIESEALLVCAWIAARRAGCTLSYAEFDINLLATEYDNSTPELAPVGKASSRPKTSRPSTRATSPRSRRRSA